MKLAGTRKVFFNYGGLLLVLAALLAATASSRSPQATQQAAASQPVFALDPAKTKVHWSLGATMHTVHGTFALKRSTLQFEPGTGKASGEVVVDAGSGESGNDSRDKKMHEEILESKRYAEIVFRPDRIDGKVPAQGTADVQIHGMFSLHGSGHEMSVPVHAEISGTHWIGTGKFSIPYVQWGLKNPSTFLLKVKPDVEIELEMSGPVRNNSTK